MSKDFSFLSSTQRPVKRQTTLFMLFRDLCLCEGCRRPQGYVENSTPLRQSPAQAPGTWERGSAQLQWTEQLYLDFLQCTSPRHQDDLARTSHIQRLQTKLNKDPVWVCKAQNTAEARGFCCISLYGCMCCTSLWGPELQERADIYRTKLQKAHIRDCTVYHTPRICVWREMDTWVCCLAGRGRQRWGPRTEVMDSTHCGAQALHRLSNLLPADACGPASGSGSPQCSKWSNQFLLGGVCPRILTAMQCPHQRTFTL